MTRRCACSVTEYRVSWRGDTVMGIDPPGRAGPLYQRRTVPAAAGVPPANGNGSRASRTPRSSRIEW